MASEHEYTIRIKKEISGNSDGGGANPVSPNGEQKPSLVDSVNGRAQKSSTANVGIKVLAVGVAKSYIQYGLSNVGKWTGNSSNQSIVNGATEAVGLGILAKANPYAAAAAVAVKAGTTFMNGKYDNYVNGLKTSRALARAGYSSINEVIGVKH